jgi:hypothetical protein
MASKGVGTFKKGDIRRVAYTQSEAVRLRFAGWQPVGKVQAPDTGTEDDSETSASGRGARGKSTTTE